eukprot:6362741-Amphidinium_carterae.1
MQWSQYQFEGEVLLQPFQRFSVENVGERGGMLIIKLRTIFLREDRPAVGFLPAPQQRAEDHEGCGIKQCCEFVMILLLVMHGCHVAN